MNIFDTAKGEIREMVDLVRYVDNFDHTYLMEDVWPSTEAIKKRDAAEKRYIELLNKYA